MPHSSTRPRALQRTGILLATLSLMAGASLLGPRAALAFAPVPETQPGYIALQTEPASLVFSDLSPGSVGYGAIRVDLDDAESAELTLRAFGEGQLFELTGGLTLVASVCDDAWQNLPADGTGSAGEATCAGGASTVATLGADTGYPTASLNSGIGSITKGEPRYILVELRMPATPSDDDERLMGQSANFAINVSASGDDAAPGPTPTPGTPGEPGTPGTPGTPGAPDSAAPPATPAALPATGVDILGTALLAFGVVLLGALALRRRPQHETE